MSDDLLKERADTVYLIGIDGGGTSCRAAVAGANGSILARSQAGPANILSGALSVAKQTLERVRDVIDRNDLPAGLEYALADKMVKAELEGFAKAVSERFGERTFLPLAAKTLMARSSRPSRQA